MAIDRGSAISLLDAIPEPDIALLVDARQLELAADHLWQFPDERIVMSIQAATLRDPEWHPRTEFGAEVGVSRS